MTINTILLYIKDNKISITEKKCCLIEILSLMYSRMLWMVICGLYGMPFLQCQWWHIYASECWFNKMNIWKAASAPLLYCFFKMSTSDCPGGNRNFNINSNAQQIVLIETSHPISFSNFKILSSSPSASELLFKESLLINK